VSWLTTLAPGIPVRICTASTTRVDTVEVSAVTATEIRRGHRRFARDGRGIGSATWLEPSRAPRPVGRPRKTRREAA
jgi:hypothetical protein